METVTSAEMYAIEQAVFSQTGLGSLMYMEYAGAAVARVCLKRLKKRGGTRAAVVCGGGNNGGDGLAAARHLFFSGINVSIIMAQVCKTDDAIINYNAAKSLGIKITELNGEAGSLNETADIIKNAGIVIDALFGIGLSRDVSPDISAVIDIINTHARYTVSVDMPSGVSADTGHIMGRAARADETVTFGYPKIGQILFPGAEHTGRLHIIDIHIRNAGLPYAARFFDKPGVAALLPARPRDSHKGTFGKAVIIGGSDAMPGAVCLAAAAAYRAGCGLVRVCSTAAVTKAVIRHVPECVTTELPESNGYISIEGIEIIRACLNDASCALIGPGLGRYSNMADIVHAVISNAKCPLIIDADALYAMDANMQKKLGKNCVITPHPKEMSRLSGMSVGDIVSDPIKTAAGYAEKHNCVTLLKGARTVITAPGAPPVINTTGSSALAKAGSGDCLAGIIASFAAQGIKPPDACYAACWIFGKAGEKAAEKYGGHGVTARDVIKKIPKIIKGVIKHGKRTHS